MEPERGERKAFLTAKRNPIYALRQYFGAFFFAKHGVYGTIVVVQSLYACNSVPGCIPGGVFLINLDGFLEVFLLQNAINEVKSEEYEVRMCFQEQTTAGIVWYDYF